MSFQCPTEAVHALVAYCEVHQSLIDHRKVIDLSEILDTDEIAIIGHLVCLWLWALDNAPGGVLPQSVRTIARGARWKGDPSSFFSGLKVVRLIDVEPDGTFLIHDWKDGGGKLEIVRRQTAERVRKHRARNADVTRYSNGGVTLRNAYREEDKPIREDSPPTPSLETGDLTPGDFGARVERGGSSGFNSFLAHYPVCENQSAALKELNRLKPDSNMMTAMKEGQRRWKSAGTEDAFWPDAAKWLKERRWEDTPRNRTNGPRAEQPVKRREIKAEDFQPKPRQ